MPFFYAIIFTEFLLAKLEYIRIPEKQEAYQKISI